MMSTKVETQVQQDVQQDTKAAPATFARGRGRPSKYHPSMCDTIIEVAAQGGHIAEMRLAIDCRSKETWYYWQDTYPEFKEAVEYAQLVSQAFYEKIGLKGACGQIKYFNATTYALIMNNKFGDEYKRTNSGANTEITINQLNMSPEQLEQKIQAKMKLLESMGVNLGTDTNDTKDAG